MSIEPTKPTGIPGSPDAARLQQPQGAQLPKAPAANRSAAESGGRVDSAEFSPAARALSEQVGPQRSSASGLSPARLKQLLQRLLSGFYDRPEVQRTIAQRVSKDPDLHATE